MARRVTQAEVASVKKTINPYSQPCFTTYTMHDSHGGGYYLYDHNLNLISADHATGGSSYGSFRSQSEVGSNFKPRFLKSTEKTEQNRPKHEISIFSKLAY